MQLLVEHEVAQVGRRLEEEAEQARPGELLHLDQRHALHGQRQATEPGVGDGRHAFEHERDERRREVAHPVVRELGLPDDQMSHACLGEPVIGRR